MRAFQMLDQAVYNRRFTGAWSTGNSDQVRLTSMWIEGIQDSQSVGLVIFNQGEEPSK
jgi:hypothetical protein